MPRRKKSSHENHSRSSLSINKDKPQQRYAANARERARMRVLSRAFCRLKTTLPWVPADTKLSKLDTLRLAASYIAHLKGILRDETLGTSESSLHPAMSLVRTWPFGFNRPLGGSTGGGSQQGGSLQGSDLDDMDEEDEDNDDDYDGDSISSCTWEEVNPPTKECVHLDGSPKKGNAKESRRSSQGRTRGNKRANNNTTASSQVCKRESASSSLSPSSLSKQTREVTAPSHTAMGAPRPLSQAQQQIHHLPPEQFQMESNNNVMFHHHHHHSQQSNLMMEARDKSGLSPSSSEMMTVTNLENTLPPFLQPHSEGLVGIGGTLPPNNESFVDDGFLSHQSHLHQDSHLNHMHHEMHGHHHIAPGSTPFGYGNDLISIG